jgi:spermidine synthase
MKKTTSLFLITLSLHAVNEPQLAHTVENNNDYLLFREVAFHGVRQTIPIIAQLESVISPYQKIDIYDTACYGRMMVIDGIIMLTQFDNHAYHEMMVHVPMQAHPNPETILIVGGGDGGALTEVLKYPNVKKVVLCEIDKEVIRLSKKYFPEWQESFSDPRVEIVAADGSNYVKQHPNSFDVICVDSTDNFGPAQILFQKPFYENLQTALTQDGIAVTQSESIWYDKELIRALLQQNKEIFSFAAYYYTIIPTYPSGTIGFSFCSKNYTPYENLRDERIAQLVPCKYYNRAIHHASFALPQFITCSFP